MDNITREFLIVQILKKINKDESLDTSSMSVWEKVVKDCIANGDYETIKIISK